MQDKQRSGEHARLELALVRALHFTGLTLPQITAAEHRRILAAATRAELQALLRALGLAQLAEADWSQVAAGLFLAVCLGTAAVASREHGDCLSRCQRTRRRVNVLLFCACPHVHMHKTSMSFSMFSAADLRIRPSTNSIYECRSSVLRRLTLHRNLEGTSWGGH